MDVINIYCYPYQRKIQLNTALNIYNKNETICLKFKKKTDQSERHNINQLLCNMIMYVICSSSTSD